MLNVEFGNKNISNSTPSPCVLRLWKPCWFFQLLYSRNGLLNWFKVSLKVLSERLTCLISKIFSFNWSLNSPFLRFIALFFGLLLNLNKHMEILFSLRLAEFIGNHLFVILFPILGLRALKRASILFRSACEATFELEIVRPLITFLNTTWGKVNFIFLIAVNSLVYALLRCKRPWFIHSIANFHMILQDVWVH